MRPCVLFCMFQHSTDRKSLLVSAMSTRVICKYQLRLSRLSKLVHLRVFLLAFIISASSATSCPYPCSPATQCVPLDHSSCGYGVVKDICECCDVCAHGPGDLCGPYGRCGTGLICVQGYEEGLSEQDLRDYPSYCEHPPTPSKLQ